MKPVKVDKNGTQYFEDWSCPRCGGQGGSHTWDSTGYTCYDCYGTGKALKPRVTKVYTKEYQAKLDAKADAKLAKEYEEAILNAPKARVEWLAKSGFTPEGVTYVFVGDTFSRKDRIKELGGVYCPEIGWHAKYAPSEFDTVETYVDTVCTINDCGCYEYKTITFSKPVPESHYLGEVGQKVELELTLIRVFWITTQFGTLGIHKFEDADGNIVIWKTSCDIGDFTTGLLTGTIKEHSEYNGVKQTVLTRCKVK